ncbi:hypothetical protein [Streptacidiphilus sp. MAP12-16]|uniref:hypothetical protein n=1 Tax=Streptacidiphilus sp. MAP12-16 TaxID=3156300 RepID=UPI0035182808
MTPRDAQSKGVRPPLGHPQSLRDSRAELGSDALLAVTQFVILDAAGAHSSELARAYAAAALPNRRKLLQVLGFHDADALDDALVDALISRGTADDIAHRVAAHFAAGADHVSLYVLTAEPATPPIGQWRELAARLLE